ncbi:MAK10-like protein [Tanacetum coccineum]
MGDENPIRTSGSILQYLEPQGTGIPLSSPIITTWEDLTTRFLAQFFPPGRTTKLRNDILMFQQHHGESLSEAWSRFRELLQRKFLSWHRPWLQALLEDPAFYDNKSWNDPRDFAKPVKAIALPQDVPSTSDHRLIKLKNQVQRLMETHLALTQPTQVNKVTASITTRQKTHHLCPNGGSTAKMEDPDYSLLPCRLGDSKPFDTLADLGSCINIIPLYLFKKLNIGLLEETDHIFGLADGTKSYPVGIVKDVEVHIGKLKLLNDFYMIDMKKDSETPLLVGRGFLDTANTVIDCRMAKIAVGV